MHAEYLGEETKKLERKTEARQRQINEEKLRRELEEQQRIFEEDLEKAVERLNRELLRAVRHEERMWAASKRELSEIACAGCLCFTCTEKGKHTLCYCPCQYDDPKTTACVKFKKEK